MSCDTGMGHSDYGLIRPSRPFVTDFHWCGKGNIFRFGGKRIIRLINIKFHSTNSTGIKLRERLQFSNPIAWRREMADKSRPTSVRPSSAYPSPQNLSTAGNKPRLIAELSGALERDRLYRQGVSIEESSRSRPGVREVCKFRTSPQLIAYEAGICPCED